MLDSSSLRSTDSGEYRAGAVIAGKYRLERLLGEGGQACVWQAQNLALDVGVAIKFVPVAPGNAPQIARLQLEARTAARLRHPGIVRVFDFGQTDVGDSFLVMELLEGQSLADMLATSTRLTPEQALRILLPIAEAIGAAHDHGIVHRDIKPDNIFLSTFEQQLLQPKLLDFGVAKVGDVLTPHTHLTRAGTVVGSPAYLSPEQARGEANIDHRSDIWAFAATLYQTIAGRLPFWQETYNALLWSIVEDEPTPTVELGAGDAALWEIIRRGLAKPKAERWESMQAFGRALAAWLVTRGVADDVTGAPLRSRWLGSGYPDASAPVSSTKTLKSETHSERRLPANGKSGARPIVVVRHQESTSATPLSRSVSGAALRPRSSRSVIAAVAMGLVGTLMLWLAPRIPTGANAAPPVAAAALGAASRPLGATTVAAPSKPAAAEAPASAPRVTVVARGLSAPPGTSVAPPRVVTPAPRPDARAASDAPRAASNAPPRSKEPAFVASLSRLRPPPPARSSSAEAELMNPY
jgi:serine/threonine protein kinase